MSKEATVADALRAFAGNSKARCVRCGTSGSFGEVFKVGIIGAKSDPNSAIPVIAGNLRTPAWVCKICPGVYEG